MADELVKLIVKADFAPHVQLAEHMEYDRFMEPHVLNAQLYDLRPVLGDPLYVDLVKNRASSPYTALIAGGEYTYNGKTYFFQGLKKVLAHFAYSRYCIRNGVQDTASGLVRKKNEFSDAIDVKESSRESEYHKQLAVAALNDVMDYIRRNIASFPLYSSSDCCGERKSVNRGAIRITPVSR